VADQVLRDLLGDAIAELLDRHEAKLREHFARLRDWVGDVAEPPPGVELRCIDGSRYTGIVLVERNVVIAMIAFRHAPDQEASPPPEKSRTPEPYQYPADGPLWRERAPYR
jgi:hypothetical protein